MKKHKGANYNYNLYIIESIYLLLIDISLIAPVTLLTLEEKDIHYSEISAIALAPYTCYKIIMSSINYKKTRHIDFLNIRTLRSINFIDALVSILNLQYALIKTFDNNSNNDMHILTIISSFLIYCFIIFVSVRNVLNAFKLKQDYKSNMC